MDSIYGVVMTGPNRESPQLVGTHPPPGGALTGADRSLRLLLSPFMWTWNLPQQFWGEVIPWWACGEDVRHKEYGQAYVARLTLLKEIPKEVWERVLTAVHSHTYEWLFWERTYAHTHPCIAPLVGDDSHKGYSPGCRLMDDHGMWAGNGDDALAALTAWAKGAGLETEGGEREESQCHEQT